MADRSGYASGERRVTCFTEIHWCFVPSRVQSARASVELPTRPVQVARGNRTPVGIGATTFQETAQIMSSGVNPNALDDWNAGHSPHGVTPIH
jgi:hypothetical protein